MLHNTAQDYFLLASSISKDAAKFVIFIDDQILFPELVNMQLGHTQVI